MSGDQFLLISKFLHFTNKETGVSSVPKKLESTGTY